jgi:hypothetical protein
MPPFFEESEIHKILRENPEIAEERERTLKSYEEARTQAETIARASSSPEATLRVARQIIDSGQSISACPDAYCRAMYKATATRDAGVQKVMRMLTQKLFNLDKIPQDAWDETRTGTANLTDPNMSDESYKTRQQVLETLLSLSKEAREFNETKGSEEQRTAARIGNWFRKNFANIVGPLLLPIGAAAFASKMSDLLKQFEQDHSYCSARAPNGERYERLTCPKDNIPQLAGECTCDGESTDKHQPCDSGGADCKVLNLCSGGPEGWNVVGSTCGNKWDYNFVNCGFFCAVGHLLGAVENAVDPRGWIKTVVIICVVAVVVVVAIRIAIALIGHRGKSKSPV